MVMNGEKTRIISKLLETRDLCKGRIKPDEFCEAVALFLALGTKHPGIITEVLKDEEKFCAPYEGFLYESLAEIQKREPDLPWDPSGLSRLSNLVARAIAEFTLYHLNELPITAQAVRQYYAERYHRPSRSYVRQASFFQYLLGDLSGKSFIDSHCGLAFKSQRLKPKHGVFVEDDSKIGVLSHRFHIAEKRDAAFIRQDYLLGACGDVEHAINPLAYEPELYDTALVEPPAALPLSEQQRLSYQQHFPFVLKPEGELPSTATLSLWLQQTFRQLKKQGKAYVIVPDGWLSRGGYDGQIRDYFLSNGHVESVIALDSILDWTSLLVIRKSAKADEPVRFMKQSSALMNALAEPNSSENSFYTSTEQDSVSVDIKELQRGDANGRYSDLSPQRFLKANKPENHRDTLAIEQRKLAKAEAKAKAAQSTLEALMDKYGR